MDKDHDSPSEASKLPECTITAIDCKPEIEPLLVKDNTANEKSDDVNEVNEDQDTSKQVCFDVEPTPLSLNGKELSSILLEKEVPISQITMKQHSKVWQEPLKSPSMPNVKSLSKNQQKKKKSRSNRVQDKPTGFERWATDAPISAEEADYESRLYAPNAPFLDRLDDALIRFQMARRFEPARRNIFMKYLQYGGVTVSQNYGTGIGTRELREMGDEEAARARSQTMIERSRENLEVNFDLTVKGYLSSYFQQKFRPESLETIELATVSIRNFLNYLIYHNVCPEYNTNILMARETCDVAELELWKNMKLIHSEPGNFNIACAELLGPNDSLPNDGKDGDKKSKTELTFKLALTATTGDTSFQDAKFSWKADLCPVKPIPDIDGFEVISVKHPSDETKLLYANSEIEPVGIIHAKPFLDPAKPAIDMGPNERKKWDAKELPFNQSMNLPLELKLLQNFYPGQKIFAKIYQVPMGSSSPGLPGVFFCGDFMSAYPSFYTFLGNDLMVDYKPSRAR